jgi:outer membrane protein assembly factor BamB/tRNA A-37 threonylcarbamoyl transferase component Bud32
MFDYVEQQFGNYRLLRLLGHGGFADVYLGRHVHLETQAAIKILRLQLVGEEIEHFRQEARTVARLEHPNIVHILDFGVQNGIPFLVMNYAPNGTLRQRHPRGSRVPLPVVIIYAQQVASALQYAHDQHVIHRDIKPENLLIGANQQILLSDFGIARIMPDTHSLHTHEMSGTTAYVAPEQLDGRSYPASDQYALAVLVYEWLSGVRPFEGSFTEIAFKQGSAPVPPLREKVPDLSPAVEEVILTALKKEPRQRFATIQAFAFALEQASKGTSLRDISVGITPFPPQPALPPPILSSAPVRTETVTPQSQSPIQMRSVVTPIPAALSSTGSKQGVVGPAPTEEAVTTVRQPTRPNLAGLSRRAVLTGLAGLVVLGGGVGIITWLNRTNPAHALPPSSNPQSAAIPANTRKVNQVAFGFDLQHTHFNPVEQQLSPATVARLKPYWVASTGSTINSSPSVANGIVYIGSDDHRLYALNASTGKPLWIATTNSRVYSTPTVYNGAIYVGSSDGKLYAFNAATGRLLWTVLTRNQIYSSPLVVNGIVYIGSFDANLYAFDAATGTLHWVTPTDAYLVSSPALSNGILYIGSGGGKLYAINASSGNILWSTPIGSRVTSSPSVADGRVYVGSSDMYLYALAADSGKVLWRSPTEDVIASSPALVKGIVYIGSADSRIYAFHAATGKLLWSTRTYNQVNSSPTVANGVLYIGSWDGLVYACDAATGKILWTGYTTDHIFSSPAVVNGVVYIASWDSKVYAFHIPGAPS